MELTDKEKKLLVFLICAALAMVAVSTYLGSQVQQDNDKIINNRIHILHSSGSVESDFKEKYSRNKSKIGQFDVHEYEPMVPSQNASVPEWNRIAQDIYNAYPDYDAFLIVCGKDTMSYTASALAFMLENVGKPVVLCDEHVTDALILTSQTSFPEVMVASRGKLLRGCRTVAGSTEHMTSPNYPPLKPHNVLSPPEAPLNLVPIDPGVNIVVVRAHPGKMVQQLASILGQENVHGIVLETFGDGKLPVDGDLLAVISALVEKGIVMVAVSQCHKSRRTDIDMRILEAGVLPGCDMTTQAAYTKLALLLSNVQDKTVIGKIMDINLRGEVTPPVVGESRLHDAADMSRRTGVKASH